RAAARQAGLRQPVLRPARPGPVARDRRVSELRLQDLGIEGAGQLRPAETKGPGGACSPATAAPSRGGSTATGAASSNDSAASSASGPDNASRPGRGSG